MMLVDIESVWKMSFWALAKLYQKYTIISTELFLKMAIFSDNIILCLSLIKIDDNNRKEFSHEKFL